MDGDYAYAIFHVTYVQVGTWTEEKKYAFYTLDRGKPKIESGPVDQDESLDALKKRLSEGNYNKANLEEVIEYDQKVYLPDEGEARKVSEHRERTWRRRFVERNRTGRGTN